MRELRAAVADDTPLVLVHERDPTKGGERLPVLIDECPADLRPSIFREQQGATAPPIPWLRANAMQHASLLMLVEAILRSTPLYARGSNDERPRGSNDERRSALQASLTSGRERASDHAPQSEPVIELMVRFPLVDGHHQFTPPPPVLYVSASNPGAQSVAEMLRQRTSELQLADVLPIPQSIPQSSPAAPTLERSAPARLQSAHDDAPKSFGSRLHSHSFHRTRAERARLAASFNLSEKAQVTTVTAVTAVTDVSDATETESRSAIQEAFNDGSLQSGSGPFPELVQLPSSLLRKTGGLSSWWGARAHTAAEGGGSITHFLLYLNDETFGGMQGEALAQELRAARAAGLVVVLVHEQRSQFGAVDFDRMFHVTPADLVKDGLYRQIATSLHDSPLHVAVAVALIVEGLGAKRTDASRFSGV